MVKFEICESTGYWCKYTAFYVEHRQRIIPGYQVKHALADVKHCMRNGSAAILTNEQNQVIGIGGFVLGLEKDGFNNKNIAVLGNSYFAEEYRSNRTFIRGLQVLAEKIGELNGDVREVRIPTSAGNAYTNGLYRKFAEMTDTAETPYGPFHIYSVGYDAFASFCGRFRQSGQAGGCRQSIKTTKRKNGEMPHE
ncbi:hypothetical protein [Paenibacillus arenilitoris]|uniref:Uncharacterized protein n=1 Tax=Paenibacillus arenilitoris TaxID=2772299 RepID=A0A927H592_9BACL|nr:hypothetical protein [Paenibacillus arenilitoris]MBD2868700.1 hypothetical protein [Paenibacillus arenilitoris]